MRHTRFTDWHLLLTPKGLKSWGSWLPSRCAICQNWPHAPVCDTCIGRFAAPMHRCLSCALPLPALMRHCGACLQDPPPLDLCLTATAYAWPWVGLLGVFALLFTAIGMLAFGPLLEES